MKSHGSTRRQFLAATSGVLAGALSGRAAFAIFEPRPEGPRSPSEKAGVGAVGMRYQGTVIAEQTLPYAEIVAICDVDRKHGEAAKEHFGGGAALTEDYRRLMDRKDVDVVTIGTPDHWHTAIAIAACRAGKDVYCEKPLTLTIDEGKVLCRVVRETRRVFQVGSWQRSDHRFRLACEIVQAGLIGQLERVLVVLGKNKQGGPFPITKPPAHLNWDMWQGQTPSVPYIKERTHYTFRWWYEYSGGQMTDWGAHHVDIAQWGMGVQSTGPIEIVGRAEFPTISNGYNVATEFGARLVYPSGLEMEVRDHGENGVTFFGEKGRVFVNRATIRSDPPELVKDGAPARDGFKLYEHDNLSRPPRVQKKEATRNHMGNFFDCIQTRKDPISDVVSQHRSVSACHLANISMRLGRQLRWDPQREAFPHDEEANGWLQREQRKPYVIEG